MAAVGRPTDYKEEYNEQAYKLCLLGATDAEIADFFGIAESTLNNWKKKFPDFMESIRKGKTIADAEVAEALYNKARGFVREGVKIFNANGEPLIVPYMEYYAPDTGAAFIWLKNRQSHKWRDKHEVEQSGNLEIKKKAQEIEEYLYGKDE